jgi:hypothetical protein
MLLWKAPMHQASLAPAVSAVALPKDGETLLFQVVAMPFCNL